MNKCSVPLGCDRIVKNHGNSLVKSEEFPRRTRTHRTKEQLEPLFTRSSTVLIFVITHRRPRLKKFVGYCGDTFQGENS